MGLNISKPIHNDEQESKKELRIVERLTAYGSWEVLRLIELKKGDIFRLFEPGTREPVQGEAGATEFVATDDAWISGERPVIPCKPVETK